MSVKVFFCYAHEDEPLMKKLKMHLRPLQRQGLIDVWHDRDISAGTEWEREISEQLNTAQVILLLVSPDFMNSDYCYSVEMKLAIERHERKEACVIPIILDYVYWQVEPLSKLQVLPTDAEPIMSASWHSQNEAFLNVVKGILKVVMKLLESFRLKKLHEILEEFDKDTSIIVDHTLRAGKVMLFLERLVQAGFSQEEAYIKFFEYAGQRELLVELPK